MIYRPADRNLVTCSSTILAHFRPQAIRVTAELLIPKETLLLTKNLKTISMFFKSGSFYLGFTEVQYFKTFVTTVEKFENAGNED